jgi:uncharacterized protein (DUF2267 family)
MKRNINKYAEEAHKFFRDVATEIGNPNDTDHAGRVTTAVLHALRERITPEESMHIISQLPMILKGIYVDGWKITKQLNNSETIEDFLNDIRSQNLRTAGRDFGDDQQARETVTAVLNVMKQYVDEGEINHIKQQLPEPLAELF